MVFFWGGLHETCETVGGSMHEGIETAKRHQQILREVRCGNALANAEGRGWFASVALKCCGVCTRRRRCVRLKTHAVSLCQHEVSCIMHHYKKLVFL